MNTSNSNLFIMRHGQTETNRLHIWQCSMDEPLNDVGRSQAESVSSIIGEINPEIVITSNLKRAVETARIASGRLDDVEFVVEKDLRERSCGEAEGLTTPQILDRYGIRMEMINSDVDRIPGAEPYSEFLSRITGAMDRLRIEYEGRKALIVSHGGVMRTFYNTCIGPVPSGVVFRNCSILSLRKENGTWEIIDKLNTEQI